MKLHEAENHIGDAVVYDPGHGARKEDGTIMHVRGGYVMVRYGHNDSSVKATHPDRLELLCP